MATDPKYVDFILDQLSDLGGIFSRKMFGEYALYCDGKVVALVCDDQLFVKPTEVGRQFIGEDGIVEAPAYPGAKPSFLITDEVEDRIWITELIRLTADALPQPKPKAPRKKKS